MRFTAVISSCLGFVRPSRRNSGGGCGIGTGVFTTIQRLSRFDSQRFVSRKSVKGRNIGDVMSLNIKNPATVALVDEAGAAAR